MLAPFQECGILEREHTGYFRKHFKTPQSQWHLSTTEKKYIFYLPINDPGLLGDSNFSEQMKEYPGLQQSPVSLISSKCVM